MTQGELHMNKRRYASAQALEQAVKASARKSHRDTNREIAGFYRDRLLCRIFSEPNPRFVLKGGQSQLARRADARETKDIDLVGVTTEIERALEDLKELAAIDLHDFIDFQFLSARAIPVSQEYRTGMRVEFVPVLGKTKRLSPIGIDLVVDQTPPNDYVLVSPVNRLDIAGLPIYDYALQTIEERIADKVCAMMQIYDGATSSRVKDLVDLVVSKLTDVVDADIFLKKLQREVALRHMEPIEGIRVPSEWKTPRAAAYRKEALKAPLPAELANVVDAEAAIASWLNPVLHGEHKGTRWDPFTQSWINAEQQEREKVF